MKGTSARLLRLLILLQVRRTWSSSEIAERLGVTQRTVRRDMQKLRDLEYPVTGFRGVAGGYRLGVGSQLPPLALDDEEAVAIAIALQTAATSGVVGVGEAALRALIKLEQMMPSRLRSRARALRVTGLPAPSVAVDAELLSGIGAACRDHVGLQFAYAGLGGAVSLHRTEPHELLTWGSRWYLIAWDIDADEWATFPVDRIQLKGTTGLQFKPRKIPDGDAATHVARSVAQLWPHQAKTRVQRAATTSKDETGRGPGT
jgi:predicted DNA-binding transcriptional regulator YafY